LHHGVSAELGFLLRVSQLFLKVVDLFEGGVGFLSFDLCLGGVEVFLKLTTEAFKDSLITIDLIELGKIAPMRKADSLSVSFASDELTNGVGSVKEVEDTIVGTIIIEVVSENFFDLCH
jgi:hypothetical protein